MIENLLGITAPVELSREEERLSKIRAMELWDKGILEDIEPGTVSALCAIHRYLFQDVYPFAGVIRTVDISKGTFRFAHARYLDTTLAGIEKMPDSTLREIIDKYVEMNVAHPFREGNGRATRLWLDVLLARRLGQRIQWENITRAEYMEAMIRSSINPTDLHLLMERAVAQAQGMTRATFARAVNASYRYEGCTAYDAATL